MTLDAAETLATDPAITRDVVDAAFADVWRSCLCHDEALWGQMIAESDTHVSETAVEELMRQTLLFTVMDQHAHDNKAAGSAVSVELLEALVRRERDPQSIVNQRALPLFVKTLQLAQYA